MKRRLFAIRVDQDTPEIVDAIAKNLGYQRIDGSGMQLDNQSLMFITEQP